MTIKLLTLSFILVSGASSSFAHSEWIKDSVQVQRRTEMQRLIDLSFTDLFSQPQNKHHACQLFLGEADLVYSHGISPDAARLIQQDCSNQKSLSFSKNIAKSYYISPTHERFESWTDQVNRTFLFVDENIGFKQLQTLLLHELAMTLDAKNSMFYTTYLRYEILPKGQRVVTISKLPESEQRLQNAFNLSLWYPIARTFAVMRAYQVEKLFQFGKIAPLSHDQCVSEFQALLPFMKGITEPQRTDPLEIIVTQLSDLTDRNFTPHSRDQEIEQLNTILDPDLRLRTRERQNLSFCQYMSFPLLSPRTLHNGMAHGPRPRVTGGSGGQGGGDNQTSSGYVVPTELNNTRDIELRLQIKRLKESVKTKDLLNESERPSFLKEDWEDLLRN